MKDDPDTHYVTKEELMHHAEVIWMFIMLILIMMVTGANQVFQVVLFAVSFVTMAGYMLSARALARRKRRPKE